MTSATGSAGPQTPQRRVELRFRALRNALGNFGRRTGPDNVLIAVTQDTTKNLTFKSTLPVNADKITAFYSDGTEGYIRLPATGSLTCTESKDVDAVEVAAKDGVLLAFGVVRQV